MAGRTAWVALILLLGGASARPDLAETAVSVFQHGTSLRVTDVVRNAGGKSAQESTTGYYLAHVRIGGRPVVGLPAGASSRGSTSLTIPASVPLGSYRLLACADDRKRVKESGERNNCRASSQLVTVTDRTPPVFGGLKSATTCIPGPAGGGTRRGSYHLRWEPAQDNVTATAAIVYDVYQATTPGGEDFSAPTYTSTPGATSFSTLPLPDDKSYSFVVRARDKAGNRDRNKVERSGVNLCV